MPLLPLIAKVGSLMEKAFSLQKFPLFLGLNFSGFQHLNLISI